MVAEIKCGDCEKCYIEETDRNADTRVIQDERASRPCSKWPSRAVSSSRTCVGRTSCGVESKNPGVGGKDESNTSEGGVNHT